MRPQRMTTVAGHSVLIVSAPSSGLLRADDGRYYERTPNWHRRIQPIEHRR